MTSILESVVERKLVEGVEALGGIADKVMATTRRGFFDRIVLMPGGRVFFVECKRPKRGRVSPHQKRRHADYASRGATVVVLATLEQVETFIDALKRNIP